jgi:hypothetical protein
MKKEGMGRQTQKAGYTIYSGFTKSDNLGPSLRMSRSVGKASETWPCSESKGFYFRLNYR